MERQSEEVLTVEDKLTQQLAKYFSKLEKQVQKVVEENQDLPAHTVSVLVNVILEDMMTTYSKLIYKYIRMTERLSKRHTKEIIQLQQRKRLGQKRKATTDVSFKELPLTWLSIKAQTTLDDILGLNIINPNAPYKIQQNKMVHDYLKDHALTVSEKTRLRINKNIQEILTTSEKEGIGNKQVAQKIKEKFNQLETWEARRIARTEINAANNLTAHNELLNNDLVDYKMWVATSDNRTRDTHRELNGEITRIGHAFSNGLQYPGDHNGKLSEFINCRCRVVAWIPDYDKMAPTGKEYFREKDCLTLPKDGKTQVILQLPEDVKLYEVKQGFLEVYPEHLRIKPYGQQSLNSYVEELKKLFHPTVKETEKAKKKVKDIRGIQTKIDNLFGVSKKPKTSNKIPVEEHKYENLMQDIDYDSYDDELLDRVDEALQNWVDYDDRSFNDVDEITDFIDENMVTSHHRFYRVEPLSKTLKDLEVGDPLDFDDYLKSFSETREARDRYIKEMAPDPKIVIFRTNGEIKSFNMVDYAGDYWWQEEHLIHGDGFLIENITDVTEEYLYLGKEKVLLVDIVKLPNC